MSYHRAVRLVPLTATVLLCSSIAGGCDAEGPARGAPALLDADAELVVTRSISHVPPGGDGPPRLELALRLPDGRLRPLPFDGNAVGGVLFRGEAHVLDASRRLHRVAPDGSAELFAEGVPTDPAVSPDGRLLAWVEVHGHLGTIQVDDGLSRRAVAEGLASAGALRFDPTGSQLFFVGGRPGGVAGLHMTDTEGGGSRCLTNCTLETGAPWGDGYLPPPGGAEALEIGGATVAWTTGGRRVEVRLEAEP